MSIPNPLHPLLPHFKRTARVLECPHGMDAWDCVTCRDLPLMASDGQVEEKLASGPRPIETMREWVHGPLGADRCPRSNDKIYVPPQQLPDPCKSCGEEGFISRGVVERDVETGDIYRRDGKAVPRERT